MRKHNSGRTLAVAAILLLMLFDGAKFASPQTLAGQPDVSVRTAAADPLPADVLIEILRQQPQALAELKKTAVDRLRQQGTPIQEKDLSDDVLFRRIEQDPELRAQLTVALRQMQQSKGISEMSVDAATEQSEPARRTSQPARSSPVPPATDENQASLVEQPNPYPDLPSLRDLYSQVTMPTTALGRFGLDVFRNGTSNLDNLPIDLPVGPDYVLGPGDGLNIDTWGGVSQRITRTVDREGRILLPDAGMVLVAGLTLGRAQETIQQALAPQIRNVKVAVSLTRLRTVRVYVVGEVVRPGGYDISSLSTPLNALYAAGGPTGRGSLRRVRHFRGTELVREVDFYDFLLKGVRSDAERLLPGDTILVPPVGAQVTIAGMVKRPAVYELKDEKNLSETIDIAGGVKISATLSHIKVERIEAHQRRTMLSISVPDGDQKSIQSALQRFEIQDGDQITISPILPYNDATVYMEGHVVRPGKFPYRAGIQVSDLIRSYKDLLPEPADHAEIIRLAPPDYRPTVIDFNLGEILGGSDPIELQPFDTVRIFGRYEIDAPKTAIYGDVLRPGEYPLGNGMTVSTLIRMAGGFKRSAVQSSAEVASYVVENGQRVLTNHKTVDLVKAMSSDTTADLTLAPGDVVSIRRLTGWSDIGAAVTLNGEVMHPGTYAISKGEKLSSVLKRAGGFRDTAYAPGVVLERAEIRNSEEKARTELIRRIEGSGATLRFAATGSGQDQAAMAQAMAQQQKDILERLRNQPVAGRLVIKISQNVKDWEGTAADVVLRPGDVISVPERPNYVVLSGQVYSPSAISFSPGKDAAWYLKQAGGVTDLANKEALFVVRANGSVVGKGSGGWFTGSALSTRMQPGDSIVVPEKIVGGNAFWKELLNTAQFASSLAIAAKVATSF